MATTPKSQLEDKQARTRIMGEFFDAYRLHGLHVIVQAGTVAHKLGLDDAQARRCFDYLTAKGLIKPMTLGGGYAPTVELVDAVEKSAMK